MERVRPCASTGLYLLKKFWTQRGPEKLYVFQLHSSIQRIDTALQDKKYGFYQNVKRVHTTKNSDAFLKQLLNILCILCQTYSTEKRYFQQFGLVYVVFAVTFCSMKRL